MFLYGRVHHPRGACFYIGESTVLGEQYSFFLRGRQFYRSMDPPDGSIHVVRTRWMGIEADVNVSWKSLWFPPAEQSLFHPRNDSINPTFPTTYYLRGNLGCICSLHPKYIFLIIKKF
jgi:hypothetical protein